MNNGWLMDGWMDECRKKMWGWVQEESDVRMIRRGGCRRSKNCSK